MKSVSYSKWSCKYYIVFAFKCKRLKVYEKMKTDIGVILRKLYKQKKCKYIIRASMP